MTALNNVPPQQHPPEPASKARTVWIALILPIAGMIVVSLLGGIAGAVIGRTLSGMLGAAVGGLAAGITVKRFLAHGKSNGEVLFGLGATTAIGVVAIGYLYLFYIDSARQTIPTLPRNVEQTSIFVEFIAAQYAGTLWAQRLFPVINAKRET